LKATSTSSRNNLLGFCPQPGSKVLSGDQEEVIEEPGCTWRIKKKKKNEKNEKMKNEKNERKKKK